jgi:glycogen operon protein
VLDARFTARRNLLASLMLSHGVPMMLGGDELSQTQLGNNNAYCQDNEITWLNWTMDDREAEFLAFVRNLIALRNTFPSLRPLRYVESESPVPHQPGIVSWHDADGSEMMPGTWGRQDPRVLQLTIEPPEELPDEHSETLLIIFNASNEKTRFRIPKLGRRRKTEWHVILDTTQGDGTSNAVIGGSKEVDIPACCIVVATAR